VRTGAHTQERYTGQPCWAGFLETIPLKGLCYLSWLPATMQLEKSESSLIPKLEEDLSWTSCKMRPGAMVLGMDPEQDDH
jgi:hypothetical protein